MKFLLLAMLFTGLHSVHAASTITFHTKSATVWLPHQTISGTAIGLGNKKIIIYINDSSFTVPVKNQRFSFTVLLTEIKTTIWAEAKAKDSTVKSETIIFELGFKPLPVAKPYARRNKNLIELRAEVIYNPYNHQLSYHWSGAIENPEVLKTETPASATATIPIPEKRGTYYFNLSVIDGQDSVAFQTFVVKDDSIRCFNIETDRPTWIDTAVLYEITPSVFVKNGTYNDITGKLAEIKRLGVTTIWLQPIFGTQRKGQGYDIIDYFSLRPDFGDEADLKKLISVAKGLDLKVLFDIVPNHTSISHPYAQDCIRYMEGSHYYNFYQHTNDGARYSSLYETDSLRFVHYKFWKDLVNLNYQNEEVQRWMLEACKYWLRKFDIDGYRFDAVWAVNARNTKFGKRLQVELKSIKPNVLLLAEDKGTGPGVYEKGFDAAFDWEMDTTWISHWSWQYEYSPKNDKTIFNHPDPNQRAELLSKALFQNRSYDNLILRFLENNDLPRFIKTHGIEKTKMAASLQFSIPGIPLLYNGQEIGSSSHPYSSQPVYVRDRTIESLDSNNLFTFYQQLIKLRNQHKALRGINLGVLKAEPTNAVVFDRWDADDHFIVVINMSPESNSTTVFLNNAGIIRDKNKAHLLRDLLSNETFPVHSEAASIPMNKHSTRILRVE
jgi:cyclomaltodextrinase / maltogenic alpha-amylase / neopullulanase